VIFTSEAALFGREGAQADSLVSMLSSVVHARAHRYLMLNVADANLAAVSAIVGGARAPSVLPLAEPGMVALHALVPAAEVWKLLPELEAAGASSILIVPVERMTA
jgi:ATP phosphoribosyltransferase